MSAWRPSMSPTMRHAPIALGGARVPVSAPQHSAVAFASDSYAEALVFSRLSRFAWAPRKEE
jgi:hypothetical protein